MVSTLNGDSTGSALSQAQQMQLRQANRRWVVCLTNNILSTDASGYSIERVAAMFVKHQVNIVLICFNPQP